MVCFRKTFIFFIFLIAISIQLYGETFRVHELIPLKINENAEIGINDSIAVRLPEDRTFIEGLEFIIQIPKILTEWRDSVAMTVYNNVSPAPEKGIIDFYGTKQYVSTLPSKMTWPLVGFSSRFRQRKKVLLPEPDGPITVMTFPFSMTALMSLRTSLSP